ncbi:hypothetical protein THAOC_10335 [Thalassiosira oceanica]|uniref:Uncharacterized protein n=1 Tax=Thalassiosira oceanica TaxID=159749 RepID=K0SQ91_THAOC|nr:hypothetical protein THAOC_10335 [Thalassiosira oceanica]|eukprot:EJK68478.1 hypothetical protein THAOC_10335 [Thalassiosira oceanica]
MNSSLLQLSPTFHRVLCFIVVLLCFLDNPSSAWLLPPTTSPSPWRLTALNTLSRDSSSLLPGRKMAGWGPESHRGVSHPPRGRTPPPTRSGPGRVSVPRRLRPPPVRAQPPPLRDGVGASHFSPSGNLHRAPSFPGGAGGDAAFVVESRWTSIGVSNTAVSRVHPRPRGPPGEDNSTTKKDPVAIHSLGRKYYFGRLGLQKDARSRDLLPARTSAALRKRFSFVASLSRGPPSRPVVAPPSRTIDLVHHDKHDSALRRPAEAPALHRDRERGRRGGEDAPPLPGERPGPVPLPANDAEQQDRPRAKPQKKRTTVAGRTAGLVRLAP